MEISTSALDLPHSRRRAFLVWSSHGLLLLNELCERLLYDAILALQSYMYAHSCTDVVYAAYALAANSVLRCLFGTAFPLFTTQLYKSLGNRLASSIPAFLALAYLPMPFMFYKYCRHIRFKCKYAGDDASETRR
jgi:hypothetical protein